MASLDDMRAGRNVVRIPFDEDSYLLVILTFSGRTWVGGIITPTGLRFLTPPDPVAGGDSRKECIDELERVLLSILTPEKASRRLREFVEDKNGRLQEEWVSIKSALQRICEGDEWPV